MKRSTFKMTPDMANNKKEDTRGTKIADLKKKFEEERQARVRLIADFENFRKQAAKLESTITHQAVRELLEKLFPIFENFYRVSSHVPEISFDSIPKLTEEDFKRLANYFAGLKMIEKEMETVLSKAGLTRIQTVGTKFDPNLHEAISYEKNSHTPPDYIIAEIEAGWMIDGKVIKPAKVRVAKGR